MTQVSAMKFLYPFLRWMFPAWSWRKCYWAAFELGNCVHRIGFWVRDPVGTFKLRLLVRSIRKHGYRAKM